MSVYLANTFPITTLGIAPGRTELLLIEALTREEFVAGLQPPSVCSLVSHNAMAIALTEILGREVPCNPEGARLEPGDVLYVASIEGPLPPEGDEPEQEWVRNAPWVFFRFSVPQWPLV